MSGDDSLDELSYDLEEDGALVRRTLEQSVLRRGAWATVLFLYQELDREASVWRAAKIAVVRFQKMHGRYRKHSSFPIATEAEARELLSVIEAWLPALAASDGEEG